MRRLAITLLLPPFALAACGGIHEPRWSRPGGNVQPTALAFAEIECRESARMAADQHFTDRSTYARMSEETLSTCMASKGYYQTFDFRGGLPE